MYDASRTLLVHRECRALPIATSPYAAQLLENNAAVFVCPLPSVLQKFLAREVCFLDALFCQTGYDFSFRGDGGVVSSRHPAGVLTLHSRAAHENILNRFVQHMPHVQYACDVGGRDYDCIGFSSVRVRAEEMMLHPIIIPLGLYVLWCVFSC